MIKAVPDETIPFGDSVGVISWFHVDNLQAFSDFKSKLCKLYNTKMINYQMISIS